MTDEKRFEVATIRARDARVRFLGAVSVARSRIAPSRLKADLQAKAVEALRHTGTQARTTARRHPIAIGTVLSASLAFVFRRRLAALFRRLFVLGRTKYRSRHHSEDEG